MVHESSRFLTTMSWQRHVPIYNRLLSLVVTKLTTMINHPCHPLRRSPGPVVLPQRHPISEPKTLLSSTLRPGYTPNPTLSHQHCLLLVGFLKLLYAQSCCTVTASAGLAFLQPDSNSGSLIMSCCPTLLHIPSQGRGPRHTRRLRQNNSGHTLSRQP
jgi:hypothetical protein